MLKSFWWEIKDGRHGGHFENLFFAYSPEAKDLLTRNLVEASHSRSLIRIFNGRILDNQKDANFRFFMRTKKTLIGHGEYVN